MSKFNLGAKVRKKSTGEIYVIIPSEPTDPWVYFRCAEVGNLGSMSYTKTWYSKLIPFTDLEVVIVKEEENTLSRIQRMM